MRRVLVLLTLGAIAAAFVAGNRSERAARLAAERASETMRADLERAEARNRLYRLQSQLIGLLATVEARNFGEAQSMASAFFDSVRAEAGRSDQSRAGSTLEAILAQRDPVTIAITQNDAAALEMLRGAMTRLRASLGETTPDVAAGTGASPAASARK